MNKNDNVKWVRLGEYIEQCDERNTDNRYTLQHVRGISIHKNLIDTKADMKDVALTPYKILKPNEFSYVTVTSRNGDKISLAMNDTDDTFIVSSSYINFRSIDSKVLLPGYLFLLLCRGEFDRYTRFNSWGSARETFDWSEMCRVKIPLPYIEVQQELVDTYNGLKALAEQNEAMIEPLTKACEALVADCKKRYQPVQLGEYIEEVNKRNNNQYDLRFLRGVTSEGLFDISKANTLELDTSNYKIAEKGCFVYNPARINIGSIAYSNSIYIVSPMYCIFRIKSIYTEILLSEFLNIWFRRKEFQRSTLFYSVGSVRDIYDLNLMKKAKIALPPIEVQQSIVNLYTCLEKAKNIAYEAREQLKTLCPALVQRAANSYNVSISQHLECK